MSSLTVARLAGEDVIVRVVEAAAPKRDDVIQRRLDSVGNLAIER